MTLRTLIDEAQHQLCTYRNPNIATAKEKLTELLKILDLGSLEHDEITSIDEEDDVLVISTAYSIRCCAMTGEYKIPLSIIDAADPVQAAYRWLKEQELTERVENLRSCRDVLVSAQAQVKSLPARIVELEQELEAFKRSIA